MRNLLRCILDVKRGKVKQTVDRRMREFRSVGKRSSKELFKELCFCILTANYTAEGGMRIQKSIGNGFLTLTSAQLAKRLKQEGHRFPNTRAKYIVAARKHAGSLKKKLNSFDSIVEKREWLVKHVKGLGYKEASHFLRNIGYPDVAIVDFHIIDFLVKHKQIRKPKTLTPKKYLEAESVRRKVAGKLGISLGELDLYMWYCETGKVLK
jgi:N-glycosylase/DNA lyase